MSELLEWAKKEIELLTTQANEPESEFKGDLVFNYENGIYASALKAFESLVEDGHSIASISFTRRILDRLIEQRPLTPIQGIDSDWVFIGNENGVLEYQCNRYSALTKEIMPDGSITYHDINRYRFFDIEDQEYPYYFGYLKNIMDKIIGPITMPYYPTESINVFTNRFLAYPEKWDYDTIAIHYYKGIDGEVKYVGKYFKFYDGDFMEISKVEYDFRKYLSHKREILEKIKKLDDHTKQRVKDSIMSIFIADLSEDSLD